MAFLGEKGVERLWQHTVNKINEAVSDLDVQDEIYIGDGELPEGYTLQINPEGYVVEVSASNVTEGEFAGRVQANSTATANLTTAQVRNVVMTTTDPGEGATVNYPNGTVIHVYE